MIPDFKGHHFVEDSKPGEPEGPHHCDRCGLKASLRPDGSVLFDIERHGVFLKTSNIVPLQLVARTWVQNLALFVPRIKWRRLASLSRSDNSLSMNPDRPVALTQRPKCGARIIPTPSEMKRWRLAAGLTQREMGEHLEIYGSYVAYLESGTRSPSATVIARYWKIIPR